MKMQVLREICKITERRDGCVFRTKHIGYAWFDHPAPEKLDNDTMLVSVSTDYMRELNYRTVRMVKDDSPSREDI